MSSAAGAPSVIHDIGYRHYEGPRLGRGYVIRSIFSHNLRAAYGLGRPTKSKIIPILLFVVTLLPAVASVAVLAFTKRPDALIRYSAYAIYLQPVIAIFVAAQAPVLASRELRFHVTPLYFSRPVGTLDYVLAKYGAFVTALFLLLAAPVTVLLAGALVTEQSHPMTHVLHYAGGLVGCLLFALLLAALGLVLAAFTPRKGFGITAVMAVYLLSSAAVGSVQGIARHQGHLRVAEWAGMFTPFDLVDGVQVWALRTQVAAPEPPPSGIGGAVFTIVLLALIAASIMLLFVRFRKAGSK